MSASDLLPWVIGLYGFVGAVIVTLMAGGYWLGRKSGRVEHSMAALCTSMETQIQLTGVVIGALKRQRVLTDEDEANIIRTHVQGNIAFIRQTVKSEEKGQNPLSSSELQRLNSFIAKAERGELLTHAEIQEYNQLVGKLKEDKGVDPGVVALLGLGALLLGIWLGSQSQSR